MDPAMITTIIMIFAIVMFAWEKLPLAVSAMIVMLALHVTGVLTPAQTFAGFVNSSVILFATMFVVSDALFRTGVAVQIAGVITRFAKTEKSATIATMFTVGVVSSFMSNTAAAAIFLPIVIGICKRGGFSRSRMLMPMAFAATMGGSLSLIASPGNVIAHSVLQEHGYAGFTFFNLGYVGFPALIFGIAFFYILGNKLIPDRQLGEATVKENESYDHVPAWKKQVSIGTLAAIVLAMVFIDQLNDIVQHMNITLHVISSIGALFLVVVGVLDEKEAYQAIEWKVIFLFAGTLPLATALDITGAGANFAAFAINLLGGNPTPLAATAMVYFTSVILTTLMSNTATTALLAPIAIAIAHQLGADPTAAAAATVVGAAMAFATPIATPPNTIVYGHGGYRFTDYVIAGTPLVFVMAVPVLVLLPLVFPFFP